MTMNYPEARRDESIIENHFGHEIKDPYRWLENPDSEETQKFVEAQNIITRSYLDSCPYKEAIFERLKEVWNYPRFSCPAKHGEAYYYHMNSGLQNHYVYYKQTTLTSDPQVFLDPNLFSEDGSIALSGAKFSEDDSIYAYGQSKSGSDWKTIYFKNTETGEDYPDQINKVKFSGIAWTHDNKGIFYGAYPDQKGKTDGSETSKYDGQKLFYHRVGTDQAEDVLCVEFPEEPSYTIHAEVSECGRYLIVHPSKGTKDNLVFYSDLEEINYEIKGKLKLTQIVHKFEADYDYVVNIGQKFIYQTNKNAPNSRLIVIDLNQTEESNWETLIPEHPSDVLQWATPVYHDKLIVCYMHNVQSVLQLHDLNTGTHLDTFPLDVGTIVGLSGKLKYSEIFYQFTNHLIPGVIYRCDLSKAGPLQPELFREIKVPGFERDLFTTKQVFYESKDGTKVSMFLVHKQNIELNGKNPCLLYGYGGFNCSMTPGFSITDLMFIQHLNAVFALPNIRGGGEYGEKWHNDGRLLNKQNVFDDFQAAADYLIANRYCSNKTLVIKGGSNGGLLVGACINQRPELFGAAIAQVGVMDMLRYHKFTIGYCWASDYGSPDEEEHFLNILKYSPLHNIREPSGEDVQYPATLLTTSDHDDRVVPLHSLKFIATLQHVLRNCPAQKNPVLIRIETKAGHGAGKPTTKVIEEYTDYFCFIIQALNLKPNF